MLLLHLMWQVSLRNNYQSENHPKKAFCLYFSLDDTNNELMPRIIAGDQKITINQVLFPKALTEPAIIEKRDKGFERLKENVQFFGMKDSSSGNTIEYIEETIIEYKKQLEMMAPGTYQLTAFIDNFHDVETSQDGYSEDNAKFDYISGKLTDIANDHDIPIMCSAEFRKINAHKRPQEDDIKSTGKITYESKGTILVYNEVGVKGDSADVFWNLDSSAESVESRKMPVLEMHIVKNKFNSYKGREFLKFIPEMATFIEANEEEATYFRQMMRG